MEKTIQVLINNWVKGADTYTYNGSSWLIFTDNKQWVVELTESKTLWYNYNFFKQIFEFISLDVVDNQHHITKWVEDNVINGVNRIDPVEHTRNSMTKHLIKYGVKETYLSNNSISKGVEHIIKNGVKDTYLLSTNLLPKGVKETNHVDVMWFFDKKMEETLQNGVKSSDPRQYVGGDIIDNVIDKGIIETYNDFYHHKGRIDGVIKNGVKQTIDCDWSEPNQIDEVIEASVMKTESRNGLRKHSVGATIKYGIKETKGDSSQNPMGKVNKVIKNGDKVSGTFVGGKRHVEDVESVIGYGTKNPSV